jgi:hypothetical protein
VVPGADCHCRPGFGIRFAGWRWVGGSDQAYVSGIVVSPSRRPEAPEALMKFRARWGKVLSREGSNV